MGLQKEVCPPGGTVEKTGEIKRLFVVPDTFWGNNIKKHDYL